MFSGFNFNPAAPQQTPGSFGQQQQPSQTPSFSGQQPFQASGLFGQTQPTSQPFGSIGQQFPQQQQQQQQQQQGTLSNQFGQSSSFFNTQTPGLFGSGTPFTAQTPSAFGQSSQTPQAQFTNVYGQQQSQPQMTPSLSSNQPFSFGQSFQQQVPPQQQQSSSLFAPATPSFSQQQAQQQPALPDVLQYVELIQAAYDPSHPQCRFRHFFYNLVHPNEINSYQKPPNVDDVLWHQAVANSPDSTCMVPVLATGFDDLLKRAAQQDSMALSYSDKMKELENQIVSLQNKHQLNNQVRVQQLQRRHTALSQRLIQMMRRLQVLLHRGSAIQPQEESFRAKVEGLLREYERPHQYTSKLTTLLADLHSIQAQLRLRPVVSDSMELSKEAMTVVEDLLSEQTKGLESLSSIINDSLKDIEVIARGYHERPPIVS